MKAKVKLLHSDAKIPEQAHAFDTGHDLMATSMKIHPSGRYVEYGTGIAVQVQKGYAFKVRARSSVSKYDLVLANSVGTIDNQYQGEIILRFKITKPYFSRFFGGIKRRLPKMYQVGDRIGQIILEKTYKIDWEVVEDFSTSIKRGAGGFGSTGK